jgi:hypothetical protein
MQNSDCKTVLFEVSGLTAEQYKNITKQLALIIDMLRQRDFTSEDTAVKGMTEKLKEAEQRIPPKEENKDASK